MPYPFPPDVKALVEQRMASGKYASEDDLLRVALSGLALDEVDLAAVKAAIDGIEAGGAGVSLDEAFATVRRKHGAA